MNETGLIALLAFTLAVITVMVVALIVALWRAVAVRTREAIFNTIKKLNKLIGDK